ncbi:MAG: sigma-54-dependent Fis family transcriptional regulator [Bdellovibrionaceae bacterium]|nr:sigma-54-dependent Fis family transcriptional regulator [Pseudobdellovibrionaceae bacterium]
MNSTPQLSVLIVDDEVELRRNVISILRSSVPEVEFEIQEVENGRAAIEQVKARSWDFVLMDVRMPEINGLQALKEIKEHDPRVFVVIMTAHSNLNDAVIAIKDGAYDYVEKPVKPELLTKIVRKALEARDLVARLALSNPIFDDDIESEFVGQTQKMKEVFHLIYRLCKVDTTVLIRGDNGTGKELVAKAIHFNSPRKSGSFVAINCGAIPENLMESELFGHEKGAFTGASERKIGKFQVANNGTLFLDEVGELKPEMQVKLLRVLQEKKFTPVGSHREVKSNTRIIAATNRNLEKMMEDGLFREDLFYRLNVMPIFLPPLRERKEDIPALVQHFVKKFTKQHQNPMLGVSPEAMELLQTYRWPGNIRELENAIERAFVVETTNMIQATSLPESLREQRPKNNGERSSSFSSVSEFSPTSDKSIFGYSGPLDFDAFKEGMEKEFIINALKANKGRINQTVAQANIPKNTLLRKIRKFGIVVKDFAED